MLAALWLVAYLQGDDVVVTDSAGPASGLSGSPALPPASDATTGPGDAAVLTTLPPAAGSAPPSSNRRATPSPAGNGAAATGEPPVGDAAGDTGRANPANPANRDDDGATGAGGGPTTTAAMGDGLLGPTTADDFRYHAATSVPEAGGSGLAPNSDGSASSTTRPTRSSETPTTASGHGSTVHDSTGRSTADCARDDDSDSSSSDSGATGRSTEGCSDPVPSSGGRAGNAGPG